MTVSPSEPKVSVVIVSYNTRDLLRRALLSVSGEHEVVVVDNASSDGSAEMVAAEFPEVRLIANSSNVGFGPANNQGMDAATGSLVLLLNSDAFAEPGAVATLAAVFADPAVVAAGGKLVHPDGRLQESAANRLTLWAVFCEQTLLEKAFRRSEALSPYWVSRRLLESTTGAPQPTPEGERPKTGSLGPFDGREPATAKSDADPENMGGTPMPPSGPRVSQSPEGAKDAEPRATPWVSAAPQPEPCRGDLGPFPVAQVMGACLMMRPVERFDERFFLYCEDTELCERLSRHGKILYVPAAEFVHELGSSSQTRWEAVARYNHGKELFFAIHHGRAASVACFLMDRLGALIRMVGWALAMRSGKARLFWKVLTAPIAGPRRP